MPSPPGSSQGLNILISGIGVAGPVCAYWLLQGNPSHRITLLERSPSLRLTGQGIDIRQAGVDIVRKMGVLDDIKQIRTGEEGVRFVDENGKVIAQFGSTGDEKQQSITSEFEVFRGDLVKILLDTVRSKVDVILGEYVERYEEAGGSKVKCFFANRKAAEEYDLVIAADGVSSKIRNQALGTVETPREHWNFLNCFATYYTMEHEDVLNGSGWAEWYSATRGRVLFIRPDTQPGKCRANIIRVTDPKDTAATEAYRAAFAKGSDAVKQLIKEDFADAGWITPRLIDAMYTAGDFYGSEVAQVKAPALQKGRVTFIGDAAFCPTPLTGMGTTLAMSGAYVLAGEITQALKANEPIEGALKKYEEIMLPYSRKVQKIPGGGPNAINPQTPFGLKVMRSILWFVSATGIANLAARLAGVTSLLQSEWKLPKYAWDVEA